MHGLGLYCLLMPPKQLKQATEVAFMMLVPPRPLPRTPPMPLPMPMPTPKPASASRAAIGPAPALLPSAPLPAITAPAEAQLADEPAPEAPSGDLRTRARLAAGAAGKALRAELKQEKPWLTITQPQRQTRFEQLMAAAYQGGPMIRMEEYQTPDGRAATRVVTATGSRCYAMPANPGSGADPFNTGGKLKQVPC